MSATNPDYVPQNIQSPLAWHYTAGRAADESDTLASFPGLLDVNDILGSPGNALPPAGMVGEGLYFERVQAQAVTMTQNQVANVVTGTLPPGDWDAWAIICFELRNLPQSVAFWMAGLNLISATAITYPNQTASSASGRDTIPVNGVAGIIPLSPVIITTMIQMPIYLNGSITWTNGTAHCYGNIYARRRR